MFVLIELLQQVVLCLLIGCNFITTPHFRLEGNNEQSNKRNNKRNNERNTKTKPK